MAIADDRAEAVAATVARVHEIVAKGGVTRPALTQVREALIELGLRSELFPETDFPAPETGNQGRLYLLSEDDDHGFALYLNCATDDKNTPPHDHQTWAVVVGVRGDEHNKLYERTDDGSVEGRGAVRVASEITVRPGAGVSLLPDDIHSIHMSGADVKMHLHMYGTAIPHQDARKSFDAETGTYRHFRLHPDIRDTRGA
jgi:predicted metal-dependent enzyme (double-stranded beta helix superfamily)